MRRSSWGILPGASALLSSTGATLAPGQRAQGAGRELGAERKHHPGRPQRVAPEEREVPRGPRRGEHVCGVLGVTQQQVPQVVDGRGEEVLEPGVVGRRPGRRPRHGVRAAVGVQRLRPMSCATRAVVTVTSASAPGRTRRSKTAVPVPARAVHDAGRCRREGHRARMPWEHESHRVPTNLWCRQRMAEVSRLDVADRRAVGCELHQQLAGHRFLRSGHHLDRLGHHRPLQTSDAPHLHAGVRAGVAQVPCREEELRPGSAGAVRDRRSGPHRTPAPGRLLRALASST